MPVSGDRSVVPSSRVTVLFVGGSRFWSGSGSLHQLGDLLLHLGAPLRQREGHWPQIAVVEVGRVLEAEGRVSVAELARVLEEDDDLAVCVRVGGHSVPSLGQ